MRLLVVVVLLIIGAGAISYIVAHYSPAAIRARRRQQLAEDARELRRIERDLGLRDGDGDGDGDGGTDRTEDDPREGS